MANLLMRGAVLFGSRAKVRREGESGIERVMRGQGERRREYRGDEEGKEKEIKYNNMKVK